MAYLFLLFFISTCFAADGTAFKPSFFSSPTYVAACVYCTRYKDKKNDLLTALQDGRADIQTVVKTFLGIGREEVKTFTELGSELCQFCVMLGLSKRAGLAGVGDAEIMMFACELRAVVEQKQKQALRSTGEVCGRSSLRGPRRRAIVGLLKDDDSRPRVGSDSTDGGEEYKKDSPLYGAVVHAVTAKPVVGFFTGAQVEEMYQVFKDAHVKCDLGLAYQRSEDDKALFMDTLASLLGFEETPSLEALSAGIKFVYQVALQAKETDLAEYANDFSEKADEYLGES